MMTCLGEKEGEKKKERKRNDGVCEGQSHRLREPSVWDIIHFYPLISSHTNCGNNLQASDIS